MGNNILHPPAHFCINSHRVYTQFTAQSSGFFDSCYFLLPRADWYLITFNQVVPGSSPGALTIRFVG